MAAAGLPAGDWSPAARSLQVAAAFTARTAPPLWHFGFLGARGSEPSHTNPSIWNLRMASKSSIPPPASLTLSLWLHKSWKKNWILLERILFPWRGNGRWVWNSANTTFSIILLVLVTVRIRNQASQGHGGRGHGRMNGSLHCGPSGIYQQSIYSIYSGLHCIYRWGNHTFAWSDKIFRVAPYS